MSVKISQERIDTWLGERPIVAEWLRSLNGQTPKLYARALITFETKTQTDIEKLLKQVDDGTLKGREIRTLIDRATIELSNSNQVGIDSAVRGLFNDYTEQELPATRIHRKANNHWDEYTKEEVHEIIGYLDDRHQKACTIVAAESGLRPSTVLQLRMKHIEKDLNHREGSIALRLEDSFHYGRKKSGFPFIGKRAREEIKRLIEIGKINTNPEALLFPFTLGGIERIVKTAKENARIGKNAKPMYGFRKYYLNALNKANIPSRITDMLFGRFKDIDASNYTTQKVEELREYYDRAYAHLDYMDSNPEQSIQLGSQVTQLQDANKQLSERLRLTEEKLDFLREIQPQPTGVALAQATTQWALQPDERIFADLEQLFYNLGDLVARTRAAENVDPLRLPPMFQKGRTATEATRTRK